MTWWQSIILGIVEGVTEFLPVSSTGHLTITEKLMGMPIDDPGITAYTAIIQIGAILAAVIYFWKDIARIGAAFLKGLGNKDARDADYNMGWAVVVGTVITAGVALLGKDLITGALRSMWVVAIGLIVWSFAMFAADRHAAKVPASKQRTLETITWKDGAILGAVQCLSLVPGVSRSGATITGGLFSGLDRLAATKLSFYLGIPALVAAGCYEAASEFTHVSNTIGWGVTIIGMVVSFFVAYASIAWLLKFVASNTFTSFVVYRIVVGVAIIGLLVSNVITAV
ncbi:MAG: undecaprenyl-diphosphate phosphatase [Luteococcus japonicus]|uniref:undecaprenyl-diphosphate phosphatase n=1 Tax=Luteococcus sp. TaxID=1969402 RepID=UPI0026478FD8|nr:undecaprenyl-diphosphate phosphatase [Luteococcus sp.]MDN5562604.1 undecaprenyl-diphosphate phosphatase [Luteococcus sp.]